MGSDKKDRETTLQELKDLITKFREDRNWGKNHTPKNLAISIAIEAAELMEHYQWETYQNQDEVAIREEMADIFIYCLNFATIYDFDIASAILEKIAKNEKKYPVGLFNKNRDGVEDYHKIKKIYKKGDGKI